MVILASEIIFVISEVLSQYQQQMLVTLSHNIIRNVSFPLGRCQIFHWIQ